MGAVPKAVALKVVALKVGMQKMARSASRR